jgi:hypothetical protein
MLNVLTSEDHVRFLRDGYVFLPHAVSKDIVSNAVRGFEDAPKGEAGRARRREAAHSCISETLLRAVRELHGPCYPVALDDVAPTYIPRIRTADALHHPSPHMDMIHPTFVPDFWAVGAFVFLSPVRHLGGAFLYSPGSPNRLRAWMATNSGESGWGVTKDERIAGVVEECLADAGDVIVFQHPILHSGSENILGETTRHALRFSFPVSPRLTTKDKSIEQMSTIEKANSIDYLHAHHSAAFARLTVGENVDFSLGFGPVLAHDTLKFGGSVHRFWVSPDNPSIVQSAVSSDFVNWHQQQPLNLTYDRIIGLHLEHRFNPTLTLVCRKTDGETWSRVYESANLDDWRQIIGAPAWTLSRPHFLQNASEGPFMSKRASGSMFYFVTDEELSLVRWRCGGSRYEASAWREQGIACRARGVVTDLWCRPGPAMYRHVLVADIDGVAHFTETSFQDEYELPFRAFRLKAGVPSQLRCFERAQGYWLVTYRRDKRVYWGEVDWTFSPGEIREYESEDELRSGLATVGL